MFLVYFSTHLVLVSVGYAAFAPSMFTKGLMLSLLRNRCVFAKSLLICVAFKMKSSNVNSSFQLLESMDRLMLEKRKKLPAYTPTRQESGLPRPVAAWLNKALCFIIFVMREYEAPEGR